MTKVNHTKRNVEIVFVSLRSLRPGEISPKREFRRDGYWVLTEKNVGF